MTGRGRHLSGWLTAAGLVLAGVGVATYLAQSPTVGVPDVTTSSPAAETAPPGTGSSQAPRPAPWEPGAPRTLSIPSLDVRAPVSPIRTVGETLVPPADPQQLGWWADGARPGDRRGSALVTGHTVHDGGGALDDLEQVTSGDRLMIRTDRGRIVYEVERVKVFSKGRIANQAERLFSQGVPGRLVVITCEDWDGARYLSNVVVTARPVSA